ncbi:cytochrome b5-like heme/steroid binding domain-containing protein [Nesterenkonia ebinurensis]|uniref:cytochrome b5-like heme/steroid binding domain-containing protein n=1 Tax=Nesterenkonia ebinurensis TaxID=2608252 RepID=UPI001CC3C6A3|nr:cytochrome b5-like heme/steroid binding domain-containing protein [Nesterenkonia ebinurensis]
MRVLQHHLSLCRMLTVPLLGGALLLAAGCADDETSPDTDPVEADTATAEENGAEDEAAGQDLSDQEIAFTEVQENDSTDSCWAVVDQTVYDLTEWIDQHPGGAERIEQLCGTDATEQFTQQHGGDEGPEAQLEEFEIGALED